MMENLLEGTEFCIRAHGTWNSPKGFHRGDIGNFEADETGHGVVNITTNLWSIGCDDPIKSILEKAIIVHQGTEDFVSQPSGATGARISCAGTIN